MFDSLIVLGVALLGLVVMYFIFNNASAPEVVESPRPAAVNRKPRSKKQARNASRRYEEDVLDPETERLIAEELARKPTGLSKDTKVVEPTTLEEVRNRNAERESRKHAKTAAVTQSAAEEERQRQIDRELGFKPVDQKQRKPKKEKAVVEEQWGDVDEDDMDRKLANFFRNNKNRNRQQRGADEGASKPAGTLGGRVEVKGDITSTRTWQ